MVWAPLQSYLQINPNTPAYDNQLKTVHNTLMYKWVAEHKNIALITGHTHQPVFSSLTHLERIYVALRVARKDNDKGMIDKLNAELGKRIVKGYKAPAFRKYKPNYFNSGCCCFSDGDITGIEIEAGMIRLIKWSCKNNIPPARVVLEEMALVDLLEP